jgi:hypothetical protein
LAISHFSTTGLTNKDEADGMHSKSSSGTQGIGLPICIQDTPSNKFEVPMPLTRQVQT